MTNSNQYSVISIQKSCCSKLSRELSYLPVSLEKADKNRGGTDVY